MLPWLAFQLETESFSRAPFVQGLLKRLLPEFPHQSFTQTPGVPGVPQSCRSCSPLKRHPWGCVGCCPLLAEGAGQHLHCPFTSPFPTTGTEGSSSPPFFVTSEENFLLQQEALGLSVLLDSLPESTELLKNIIYKRTLPCYTTIYLYIYLCLRSFPKS